MRSSAGAGESCSGTDLLDLPVFASLTLCDIQRLFDTVRDEMESELFVKTCICQHLQQMQPGQATATGASAVNESRDPSVAYVASWSLEGSYDEVKAKEALYRLQEDMMGF